MSQSKNSRNLAIHKATKSRNRRIKKQQTPTSPFELLEMGKVAFATGRALNAAWLASRAIETIERESPDSDLLADALEQRAAYNYVAAKRTPDSRGQRRAKAQLFTDCQNDAERALSIRITRLGTDDHADLVIKHHNLGVFYTGNDQWAPARWHYERTQTLGDKYREKDDPGFAHSLNHLGFVYCQVGEFDLAEAALRKALAWMEAIPVEQGEEEQRAYDVQVITSQLEAIGTLRSQGNSQEHVHGPDCHHEQAETAQAPAEHVHGPDCNHGAEATEQHVHSPSCGHDHAGENTEPAVDEQAQAPAPEANAAAQQWFLQHHEEVPKAKWYAVGSDGLIGHGDDLEAVKAIVTGTGRSLEDKSLLFVCLCGDGEGCSSTAQ